MSTSEWRSSGSLVTLDQLIALNDEMVALVRAGVPLEQGLIEAGRDLRGRLSEIVNDLGTRLGQGEQLTEALARTDRAVPEVYRAVVEAGVRSGRLAQALEGMAAIARNYAEARRAIGMAMLYPLIVLSLAYGLALLFVIGIAPRFVSAFDVLGLSPLRPLVALARIGDSAVYWAPIPPILLMLLVLRWVWSGRSVVLDEGGFGPIFNKLPLVGSMIRDFRASNFAELLALLIEHHLPLADSIQLAGAASGNRSFREASEALAQELRSGEGAAKTTPPQVLQSFPPLLVWSLTTSRGQAELAPALRHLAQSYRKKAEGRGLLLRTLLPTVLMLAIGAGAVVLYALMLFVPLSQLWNELALPVNK